jgi:two-component system phosphate regulon response regulator PhoB
MGGLASVAEKRDPSWSADAAPPAAPSKLTKIVIGAVEIDVLKHRVTVAGSRVRVTPMQMRLLVHLATRRDEVLTRGDLLRDVWGYRADLQTRTVDIHVQRLRERLGPAAALISTVRGVGYRLSEDPD